MNNKEATGIVGQTVLPKNDRIANEKFEVKDIYNEVLNKS